MLKLKELRKQENLTQKAFGEIFGLFPQTYARYETEETQPPYDLLIEFANYYGVSLDYLLGRSEEKKPSAIPLTDKENRLIELYNQLVPAMQDYVLSMLEGLNSVKENKIKKA